VPPGQQRDSDLSPATPFAELLNVLHPGATGKAIVEILDGKTNRTTALHWRSGRRRAPKWVIALLADKLRQRQAREAAIADRAIRAPERPGLKAGAKNLAAYLARR
jgi:hypothetical protein